MSRATDALLYLQAYEGVKRRIYRRERHLEKVLRCFEHQLEECGKQLTWQSQLQDQRELKALLYNTKSTKEAAAEVSREINRLEVEYQRIEKCIEQYIETRQSESSRHKNDRYRAQNEFSLWFLRWLMDIDDVLLARYALMKRYGLCNEPVESSDVRVEADGTIHISYGGDKPPYGPHHGHLIIDQKGEAVYHRRPYTVRPSNTKSLER